MTGRKDEAVHLDDDPLMRTIWRKEASKSNVLLKSFESFEDLKSAVEKDDIRKETPFYIDQNLGDGLKGTAVAEKLYERGFTNIFIASGDDDKDFEGLPYIKKSIGKYPPSSFV